MPEEVGYSGTPLPKKLGIKPEMRMGEIGMPEDVRDRLSAEGLIEPWVPDQKFDFVMVFYTDRNEFEHVIQRLAESIFPGGILWLCWPKKASKVPTTVDDNIFRDVCLPMGIVDIKVCAVSDVWSGSKYMWRTELRKKKTP